MHRTSKISVLVAALAAFSLLFSGMALADNVEADADALVATAQDLHLGNVCVDSVTERDVDVYVVRNGSATGTNTFANSETIVFSSTASGTGLSAANPADIALPSNWTSLANNTKSAISPSTITFAAGSTLGARNGSVIYTGAGTNSSGSEIQRNDTLNVTAFVIPCTAATSLAVASASGTYGGTVALSATLTSGGVGVPGKSIAFTLNGGNAGSAVTNASGVATIPNASLAGINAGTYAPGVNSGVAANFTADSTHGASSNSNTLTVDKATPTVSINWSNSSYDGTANAATANVTGVGGANLGSASLTYYSGSTDAGTPLSGAPSDAGTYTVRAAYAGNSNYNTASTTKTITIGQAATTTTVTCTAGPFTYNGSAHEPCSANVEGPGGLDQPVDVSYANNTGAGTATASASFDETANYLGDSDSEDFTIGKAQATVTVTCEAGPFTYNGAAHEPCSANVEGPGGLDQSVDVTYSNNTDAGTATATATFLEAANYQGDSDSEDFTIGQAQATVTVTCDAGPFTYTGSAQTPCTAVATGPGGLNESLDVAYANNTGAGTATASASFDETANYLGDSDSEDFTIGKAQATVTVTCASGTYTYNGAAHEPCSANVEGPGGLDQPVDVSYANNTGAGTATASASFDETANYLGDSDSEDFTIGKAQATVTVTCASGTYTYNGAAHTPCTAVATGPGDLNENLAVTYDDNVNAGTVTASASFAETANHLGDTGSDTFTIDKAATSTTVTCPSDSPLYYTGSAQTPCSAVVTGPGLSESVDVDYTNNTDAGTATASATYAGAANYLGSTDSENFAINRAPTSTVVTCETGPFTYSGSPFTPCSAQVTGPALSESVDVAYTSNTNAGTATASADYLGTTNYLPSSDSETFDIDKASSSTVVTCAAGPFVYDGAAHEPCTAQVSGAGGLDESVAVTYQDNTDAGTATANAVYDGDANHVGSDDSETFDIDKASSSTVVTCPSDTPYYYTGSPQTPCSAAVTGAGGLNQSVPVTYQDNTNAGTATANAVYDGDANHEGSFDSEQFTINRATTTTVVSCAAGPHIYNGAAHTPCTAEVTGPGGLDEDLDVSYTDNTNAGTASASAAYDGTSNYLPSNDSETFTIAKRAVTVTADNKTKILGGPDPALTYQVTSGSVVDGDSFSGDIVRDPGETVGTYAIRQGTLALSDNYTLSFNNGTFKILFAWNGFRQPINDTAHQVSPTQSLFKLGQTIPVKFAITDASGNVVQQTPNPRFTRSGNRGSCNSTVAVEEPPTVNPTSDPEYKSVGGEYHYNWNTKGLTAGEYRIYANLADGTAQYVDICLR